MHEPSPLQSFPFGFDARWALLDTLIQRWYTQRTDKPGYSHDELQIAQNVRGFPIPDALSCWYLAHGKRHDVWCNQDKFLPPDKLFMHNNALIFYIENQGVVEWGIPENELNVNDPSVVVEFVDESNTWIPQTNHVSLFAIHMFTYTLAFADSDTWLYGYAEPPLLASITNIFPMLEFPDKWWTETRIFGYEDLVIAIDGCDFVHACATSTNALKTFTQLTTPDNFDRYASSDG